MPFPKKLLNDYETMALDLHPHWWYFAEPAAMLGGSLILGIIVTAATDGDTRKYLSWIVFALIVVCALWMVIRYLKWRTTNFVVTSDRLIFREGVVAKSGIEMPLERVNNVNFSQSVFERIIGAGDLVIESGGEDGKSRFTDIRRPEKVQNLIHAQMEENERRRGGFYNVAPGQTDTASQLEKLEGMLQRGTLSPEEFAAQKRKLIGDVGGGSPLPPPPPQA
jgi:uncharacterized membrane protein YdbT with pleckstrin-like domain